MNYSLPPPCTICRSTEKQCGVIDCGYVYIEKESYGLVLPQNVRPFPATLNTVSSVAANIPMILEEGLAAKSAKNWIVSD